MRKEDSRVTRWLSPSISSFDDCLSTFGGVSFVILFLDGVHLSFPAFMIDWLPKAGTKISEVHQGSIERAVSPAWLPSPSIGWEGSDRQSVTQTSSRW